MITANMELAETSAVPNGFHTIAPSPGSTATCGTGQMEPRVLVIDDESSMCDLLSLYLCQKGLEMATVRTVAEARPLVEQGLFDVVILDWKLDGAEGLDLLHLSKTLHPDIPVIIFTGADLSEGSFQRGLAHEADEVVRKMGPLDALCAAIFRRLEKHSSQRLVVA